jgi:hypothetical protein
VLAVRRMDTQLCDRRDRPQRAMRGAAQPDASGAGAGDMAGIARGGAGGPAPDQGPSRPFPTLLVPFPSAEMACWPVTPRLGSVKNMIPA